MVLFFFSRWVGRQVMVCRGKRGLHGSRETGELSGWNDSFLPGGIFGSLLDYTMADVIHLGEARFEVGRRPAQSTG